MRSTRSSILTSVIGLLSIGVYAGCSAENGNTGGNGGQTQQGSGGATSSSGGTNNPSGGQTTTNNGGSSNGNGGSNNGNGGSAMGGSGNSPGRGGGSNNNSGGSGNPAGGNGNPGSGGSSTGSGGMSTAGAANCTFNVTSSVSTKIASVGIVQFTTTLASPTKAQIDFGLDTNYGMTAPVDLNSPMYRTLLLGMKYGKTYHYKITATGASGQCTSEDKTITTGALPSGLAKITVKTNNAAGLFGGFLVMGQYAMNAGSSGSPAYILDKDNEVVWAYSTGKDVTGARMSYDGKYMWINSANVPSGQASVHRVTMDGLMDEDLSSQFTGLNHQLSILPDETVAFYAYGSGQCDDIKERSPSGTVKTIVNSGKAAGTTGACHVNTIEYSKSDDTLIFSDLDHDNYTKVKRDGTTVWVLGGSTNQFTGDGSTWSKQHGLHVIDANHLLFFNNNGAGGGGLGGSGSRALEVQLDVGAKTATKLWSFTPSPAIANMVMGDVQRLDNGNTVIAYSTQGVLQEVNSKGEVLQELTWQAGAAFGYVNKRKTLYGPPLK